MLGPGTVVPGSDRRPGRAIPRPRIAWATRGRRQTPKEHQGRPRPGETLQVARFRLKPQHLSPTPPVPRPRGTVERVVRTLPTEQCRDGRASVGGRHTARIAGRARAAIVHFAAARFCDRTALAAAYLGRRGAPHTPVLDPDHRRNASAASRDRGQQKKVEDRNILSNSSASQDSHRNGSCKEVCVFAPRIQLSNPLVTASSCLAS